LADQDIHGPAPSRRCLRLRSDEAAVVVQRPIPFNATSVSFDDEQRYRLEVQDMDWYNRVLERYLDAGYGPRSDTLGNSASIVGIFHSLPPDLAEVLKEGLHALQVLRAARATSRRPRAAATPADEVAGHIAAMEDDMWERNEQCGYLRFEWDPVTERRRSCSIPRRRAHVASVASCRSDWGAVSGACRRRCCHLHRPRRSLAALLLPWRLSARGGKSASHPVRRHRAALPPHAASRFWTAAVRLALRAAAPCRQPPPPHRAPAARAGPGLEPWAGPTSRDFPPPASPESLSAG
jgi:hypothetical protein